MSEEELEEFGLELFRYRHIVLCIGEFGAGKSSLIKIMGCVDSNGNYPVVGVSENTTTKGIDIYENKEDRIFMIDTQGFEGISDDQLFVKILNEMRENEEVGPFIKAVLYFTNGNLKKTKDIQYHTHLINMLGEDIWDRTMLIIKKPYTDLKEKSKGPLKAIRKYTEKRIEVFGYSFKQAKYESYDEESEEEEEEEEEVAEFSKSVAMEDNLRERIFTPKTIRNRILEFINRLEGFTEVRFQENRCLKCHKVHDEKYLELEKDCHIGPFVWRHVGIFGKIIDNKTLFKKAGEFVGGIVSGATSLAFFRNKKTVMPVSVGMSIAGSLVGNVAGGILFRIFGNEVKIWSCCHNKDPESQGCVNICVMCDGEKGTPVRSFVKCGRGNHEMLEKNIMDPIIM